MYEIEIKMRSGQRHIFSKECVIDTSAKSYSVTKTIRHELGHKRVGFLKRRIEPEIKEEFFIMFLADRDQVEYIGRMESDETK